MDGDARRAPVASGAAEQPGAPGIYLYGDRFSV